MFEDYSALKTSPKQEPVEPVRCSNCGNKHAGDNCAARPTKFIWKGDAKEVYLVGEWVRWQYRELLKKVKPGLFQITKNLAAGTYQYKYIVDGKWTHDSSRRRVPDNHGGFNNIRRVEPESATIQTANTETEDTYVVIWSSIKAKQLRIVGSWDGWAASQPMELKRHYLKNHQQFMIDKRLEPGMQYEFKFIADGRFLTDPSYPLIPNGFGESNNWIITSEYTAGNEIQSGNKTGSFNPTSFMWTKQPLVEFPYYNLYGHKMCVVGEYLYVVGGIVQGTKKNRILKIYLDTFTCEEIQPFDEEEFLPRAFHHLKVYGNKLLVFGGIADNLILDDYFSYNTCTNTPSVHLSIRGNPPPKREKNSCVLFKDMMIFFGGHTWASDRQARVPHNDVSILDVREMKWVQVEQPEGDRPKSRYAHSATLYNEYMYIFGGVLSVDEDKKQVAANDVWRLKLIAQQKPCWEEVKVVGAAPAPRYGHTANIINQYIVVFGGMGPEGPLNDVILLNVKQKKWIQPDIVGECPAARYFHHACVRNEDEIVVLGGKTGGKNQNAYILRTRLEGSLLEF